MARATEITEEFIPFVEHNGKRVLLVHIPKTGGSALCAWMRTLAPLRLYTPAMAPSHLRVTPQHLPYHQIRELFGEGYFDYACAVVRDPFARLESEYRFRTAVGGDGMRDRPLFGAWVERMLGQYAQNPFALDNHLRPQWQFLGHEVRTFLYEDGGVLAAAKAMAGALGIGAPDRLPSLREAPVTETLIHWDDVRRGLVEDVYTRDFRLIESIRKPARPSP